MAGLHSFYSRYNYIKQIPIFGGLSWFYLQKVARVATVVEHRKGELICKQGNPPDAFYCLVSGRVQAYAVNPAGRKYDVEFIHRGMYFGVISLLTGETHSLNYEALNDSVIVKIDKQDFQTLLKTIPNLGLELSHGLSKRIRNHTFPGKTVSESTIISVYGPVKKTGSSSYAINLAFHLRRETAKRVIFINIVSAANGQTQEASMSDVRDISPRWGGAPIDLSTVIDQYEKIMTSVARQKLEIDFLNVAVDPANTSLTNRISQFVTAFVNDYHYVVVDLPNEMNEVVVKTLTQSDRIHLVSKATKEDMELTRQVINSLEEKMQEKFSQERIEVIVSGRESPGDLSLEEVNKEIDFDVAFQLPRITGEDLGEVLTTPEMTVTLPRATSEFAQMVRKMARKISGVLVGLVLGGGAALGVAHIGVLKVLEEENIPIDIVVGSSMGALIAAFWATGKSPREIEGFAKEFRNPGDLLKLFAPIVPVSGIVGARMITRWLRARGLDGKVFYDTRVPLKIMAYDVNKREEIVLDSGSIVDAVHKSIAIPGVIEPVLERDRVIIDGGVLNPLPTNVLVKMGIKKIIAVNVLQSPDDVAKGYLQDQGLLKAQEHLSFRKTPWRFVRFRLFKIFLKLFTPTISDIIVQSLQASEYVIAQQSAQFADIVIHPDTSGLKWYELYKVDELLKRGEEATRQVLPQIKQLVKE